MFFVIIIAAAAISPLLDTDRGILCCLLVSVGQLPTQMLSIGLCWTTSYTNEYVVMGKELSFSFFNYKICNIW